MAVHHGKEGEVVVGGTAVGELVSFTLETCLLYTSTTPRD